jgi:hypothetical protein
MLFNYLSICRLFNNAVSISDYIGLNDSIINEWCMWMYRQGDIMCSCKSWEQKILKGSYSINLTSIMNGTVLPHIFIHNVLVIGNLNWALTNRSQAHFKCYLELSFCLLTDDWGAGTGGSRQRIGSRCTSTMTECLSGHGTCRWKWPEIQVLLKITKTQLISTQRIEGLMLYGY